jgi:hypothetical protein
MVRSVPSKSSTMPTVLSCIPGERPSAWLDISSRATARQINEATSARATSHRR